MGWWWRRGMRGGGVVVAAWRVQCAGRMVSGVGLMPTPTAQWGWGGATYAVSAEPLWGAFRVAGGRVQRPAACWGRAGMCGATPLLPGQRDARQPHASGKAAPSFVAHPHSGHGAGLTRARAAKASGRGGSGPGTKSLPVLWAGPPPGQILRGDLRPLRAPRLGAKWRGIGGTTGRAKNPALGAKP